MYRSGLVDMLVTHVNANSVWPNFPAWNLLRLYASSVKNQKQNILCFLNFKITNPSLQFSNPSMVVSLKKLPKWKQNLVTILMVLVTIFSLVVFSVCRLHHYHHHSNKNLKCIVFRAQKNFSLPEIGRWIHIKCETRNVHNGPGVVKNVS